MNLLNIKFLIELGAYINTKLYRINKRYLLGFKSPFWIINIFWTFFVLKSIYFLLLNYNLYPYKTKIWIVDENLKKVGLKKKLNNKIKKNFYLIKKWNYGLLTNYKSSKFIKKRKSFPSFIFFLSINNHVSSLYEANYLNIPYSFLPIKNQKLEINTHYFVPSNTTESIKFFYIKMIEWVNLFLNLKFLNNLIIKQKNLINNKKKFNIFKHNFKIKKINYFYFNFEYNYLTKRLFIYFYLKYIIILSNFIDKNKNKYINSKLFVSLIKLHKYLNSIKNLDMSIIKYKFT